MKVISMNMWGIHSPFSTPVPEREDRMIGAAKIIKKGQYDFVMFQVCKMKPRSFQGPLEVLPGFFRDPYGVLLGSIPEPYTVDMYQK